MFFLSPSEAEFPKRIYHQIEMGWDGKNGGKRVEKSSRMSCARVGEDLKGLWR